MLQKLAGTDHVKERQNDDHRGNLILRIWRTTLPTLRTGVDVRIMSGPVVGAENVNIYWYKDHFGPEKEDRPDIITLIDTIKAEIFKVETPRELVYDGDYGSVPTFYWDISFGKWDVPYVCTDPDAADRLMIRQELARNRRFHEQERRYAQWKAEQAA